MCIWATQEKYQKLYDVPMELVDNVTNINVADGAGASGSTGSLLPPVTKSLHRGGKLVSFKLDKWGFKDDVAKVGRACCRTGRGEAFAQTGTCTPHHISHKRSMSH